MKNIPLPCAFSGFKQYLLPSANTSVNFELHASEESELVIKILELAGITIKDPQLYPIASQEEQQNVQQEQ